MATKKKAPQVPDKLKQEILDAFDDLKDARAAEQIVRGVRIAAQKEYLALLLKVPAGFAPIGKRGDS